MTTIDTNVKINNYFDERFWLLFFFVFLGGFLGDVLIHYGAYIKFPFNKPWFAQGLIPYYKSFEYGSSIYSKYFSSLIISGILGGIACVIALILGEIFLYAYDKQKLDNSKN